MSIALIAACAGTEPPRIPDSAASLDNATSVSNLEENAEAGKRDAQYELGRRLELGDGIQRDAEGATRWYLAAANQGHLKAMVRLGSLYIRKEARSDQELGLRWLRRGADQGDMDAAKELSYAYLEGRGVEPDPAASTQILTVAAKSGDPQAQFLLGFAYNHGIGVPR
ncbi:MAG: sel1 repeat family protein, partial [Nitrospirae bacterium]|nr:sel1 repeat family protein [Fimbriimonadaceae bacterium]